MFSVILGSLFFFFSGVSGIYLEFLCYIFSGVFLLSLIFYCVGINRVFLIVWLGKLDHNLISIFLIFFPFFLLYSFFFT